MKSSGIEIQPGEASNIQQSQRAIEVTQKWCLLNCMLYCTLSLQIKYVCTIKWSDFELDLLQLVCFIGLSWCWRFEEFTLKDHVTSPCSRQDKLSCIERWHKNWARIYDKNRAPSNHERIPPPPNSFAQLILFATLTGRSAASRRWRLWCIIVYVTSSVLKWTEGGRRGGAPWTTFLELSYSVKVCKFFRNEQGSV